MFICGSGSFGDHEDETETYSSPLPTPKRSKRSTSFCKIIGRDNANKNPYAARGLDKFYALLADLDDKKQKIYTQKGSEDISFVRFVYTNDSDHAKPIVVKVKNQDKSKGTFIKQVVDEKQEAAEKIKTEAVAKVEPPEEKTRKKKKYCLRCNQSFKLENLKQPYFYFPVIVVLILLFLAAYGRSFAILCTSIGWYLIPSVVGSSSPSSNQRKPKRKKEYARKISEKKTPQSEGPSSPKSVIHGLTDRR